jgi:hypothetical protein
MSHFSQDGQALLVAIGVPQGERKAGGMTIMAARGELAVGELGYSLHPTDHFHDEEVPVEPGLHVWEGRIYGETGGWCGSEPIDADIDWSGVWRPATLTDLQEFGIPVPVWAPSRKKSSGATS